MPKIDDTPSKVATNALANIPFGALIGGPLDACVEAQAKSALTTVDFIKSVGFGRNPVTGVEEALTVTFRYKSNGQIVELEVPLLTIVPVPYIRVDSIGINFKANISAENSTSETLEQSSEAAGSLKGGAKFWFIKVEFEGKYSSKKDSKATQNSSYSVEYTMDVDVKASSDAMPAGLAKVLNMLEGSISLSQPSALLGISANRGTVDEQNPDANLTLSVVASDGTLVTDQKAIELTQVPADALTLDNTSPQTSNGLATVKATRKDDSPKGPVTITGKTTVDTTEVTGTVVVTVA
ncbi:MAG: DUF2589 domain-containing protein [Rhodospirillales bacterium]|nr:MAG: DUF2589 domain-containing protein [Rhodospirillales bacterium]